MQKFPDKQNGAAQAVELSEYEYSRKFDEYHNFRDGDARGRNWSIILIFIFVPFVLIFHLFLCSLV